MKTLYLLFDHEWQYKHCEISSKEEYDDTLKEGADNQQVKNAYKSDLNNEKNMKYLDQLAFDEYHMSNRISMACQKCRVKESTLNNVIRTFTDSKNYKRDIYGNCLIKVEVEDDDYNKLKERLEKLAEMDNQKNKQANKNGQKKDLGAICDENNKEIDAKDNLIR